MTPRKIQVLVAEDSTVIRLLLVHLLEADPELEVIGAVPNGEAAVAFVRTHRPDVVLMDLHMPGLDGFEATRRIMETTPVPIVICSATSDPRDLLTTFEALEAGAIACIEKPLNRERADFGDLVAHLLATVKLMSEVKVVRRTARSRSAPRAAPAAPDVPRPPARIQVIGVGASTGGPPVLHTILGGLPPAFPVPILIVQHIAHGFLEGMVDWLGQTTRLPIHIAVDGEVLRAGHVYLAPDDVHMGLRAEGTILLSREEPEDHLRPAVSFLFRSLAETCGPRALGVLLTGMGRDGAKDLKLMKDRGAITIAQDRESSVVHGMPGVAIALGGATHVLAADRIAGALVALVQHRNGHTKE